MMNTGIPRHRSGSIIPWSLSFLKNPAEFILDNYGYGDLYKLNIPGVKIYICTSPQIFEYAMVKNAASFKKSKYYWGQLRKLIGDSVGSLEGEAWKMLRQAEQPYYTPKRAEQDSAEMPAIQEKWLRRITGKKELVSIIPFLAAMNIELVLNLNFDRKDPGREFEIHHAISGGEDIIHWRSSRPWNPRLAAINGKNRKAARYKNFFVGYAADQKAYAGDENKMVHRLFELVSSGQYKSDLIANEMIVHLGASSETTAVSEGWTLYLLYKYPEALKKIREEISRVCGNRPVQNGDELVYTRQVIQESMRLYPPSHALVRDCIEETVLPGDVKLKAGDTLFMSVLGLHRNPRIWSDPDDFIPERFSAEQSEKISKYNYAPFGLGNHTCIGQHTAMQMMPLFIARFVQLFDFEFTEKEVSLNPLSTLKPGGKFEIKIKQRS
jgi:cytochrome P450